MKVRIRIACTLQELKKAIDNENVDNVFGENKVDAKRIHETITGEEINYAFLGDVYKESDAEYKSIAQSLLPIETFNRKEQLLMLVLETEVHEEEDLIFPRSCFPTVLAETVESELLCNINKDRIINLANNTNRYNQIILTRVSKLDILGAIMV